MSIWQALSETLLDGLLRTLLFMLLKCQSYSELLFQCRLLHRAHRGRDFDSHRQDFPGRAFRPGRDGLRVRRRRRRQDLGERSQRFVALSFKCA